MLLKFLEVFKVVLKVLEMVLEVLEVVLEFLEVLLMVLEVDSRLQFLIPTISQLTPAP